MESMVLTGRCQIDVAAKSGNWYGTVHFEPDKPDTMLTLDDYLKKPKLEPPESSEPPRELTDKNRKMIKLMLRLNPMAWEKWGKDEATKNGWNGTPAYGDEQSRILL